MGDAGSRNEIGILYKRGLGVNRDYREAAKWFTQSANLGNNIAEYNLGLLYEAGEGVHRDIEIAKGWIKKSALAGNSDAIAWLSEKKNEAR